MSRANSDGEAGSVRPRIRVEVNGRAYEREVEARRLLVDFLRHDLGLHGTHVGCEQGVCGACTVLLDGEPVKSCLMLAPQIDGRTLTTVEGLAGRGELHPVQEIFRDTHALQCGYCTPGFLLSAVALASRSVVLEGEALREELAGNLCRCTGYQNIVDAVERYLRRSAAGGGRPDG
jgi:carbon-monoxide dehydrogenase small subunit